MERNRSTRLMAILALVIGVVGLSIGFAALSNTLTINSSASYVPNNSTFNVDFSSAPSPDPFADNDIPGTASPNDAGIIATDAVIDNSGDPTISNLSATFNAPGQSVSYTFYAYNVGQVVGYLRSVTFKNVAGESTNKKCTPGESEGVATNSAMVTAACGDISLSLSINGGTALTSTKTDYTRQSLGIGASHTIVVTIAYANNGNYADGPFTVSFGDIEVKYSSVDGTSS